MEFVKKFLQTFEKNMQTIAKYSYMIWSRDQLQIVLYSLGISLHHP